MSGEQVLIRTVGGPYDGETRVVGVEVFGWPLPDALAVPFDGRYLKVSESDLGPRSPDSRLLRGAEYQWEENEL